MKAVSTFVGMFLEMPKYKIGMNHLWSTQWLFIEELMTPITPLLATELIIDNFPDNSFDDDRNYWTTHICTEPLKENERWELCNYSQYHFIVYQCEHPLVVKFFDPRLFTELVSRPAGRYTLDHKNIRLQKNQALLFPAWIYHSVENSIEQQLNILHLRFNVGHYDWPGIVSN